MSRATAWRCSVFSFAIALTSCHSRDVAGPSDVGEPDEILYLSSLDGRYPVVSMLPDGTRLRTVLDEEFEVRGAVWSPDRRRVAFSSWRGGSLDLWTMSAGGHSFFKLTDNRQPDEFPAWSPVDDRIAFTSSRDGGTEIYVIRADGTGEMRLTDNAGSDKFPCWSPDGNRIAFQSSRASELGRSDIWIMNADGAAPERLTSFAGADPPTFAFGPAWSPAGDVIAFVGTSGERRFDVFAIGVDGTGLVNLTDAPGSYSGLDWSPDGATILFITSRSGSNDVWSMGPDGSGAVNLTNTPEDQETSPDW